MLYENIALLIEWLCLFGYLMFSVIYEGVSAQQCNSTSVAMIIVMCAYCFINCFWIAALFLNMHKTLAQIFMLIMNAVMLLFKMTLQVGWIDSFQCNDLLYFHLSSIVIELVFAMSVFLILVPYFRDMRTNRSIHFINLGSRMVWTGSFQNMAKSSNRGSSLALGADILRHNHEDEI